jgi:hypothetical protein
MCLRGEACEPDARRNEEREDVLLLGEDVGPEGCFLDGIEEQAVVGDAFTPQTANEAGPVEDGRGGPRLKAFVAATLMESELERAGSAVAGSDDPSSLAKASVNCRSRLRIPHAWVIPRGGGGRLCGGGLTLWRRLYTEG